jgi:FkbM family methyltransferase
MISSLTGKLANSGFPKLAEFILKMGIMMVGNNVKIKFHSRNCWTHHKDSWIINEVLPDIRFDPEKQVTFIKDVYFKHYLPGGEDVFVDVGAGIGMESIFLSRQADYHGRIYAIEASPFTFGLLTANIESNHLNNIRLFNVAISDRSGEILIDDNQIKHMANSVFTDKGTAVRSITMDGFMEENQIESVGLLKVNIEGAERILISSFEKISRVKHVAISCHDFLYKRSGDKNFKTKNSVIRFLKNRNFDVTGNKTGIDYVDDWIYGSNRLYNQV